MAYFSDGYGHLDSFHKGYMSNVDPMVQVERGERTIEWTVTFNKEGMRFDSSMKYTFLNYLRTSIALSENMKFVGNIDVKLQSRDGSKSASGIIDTRKNPSEYNDKSTFLSIDRGNGASADLFTKRA